MEKLQALYKHFSSQGEAANWIISWKDAVHLYNFIKEKKIKKILDLGTGIGCSSAVMALANKDCVIDTIEQFDKCIDLANKIIPEEFKKQITIHKSEVEVWQTPLIPYQYFSVYKNLPEPPEGGWDFICNDGPSPILIDGENFL